MSEARMPKITISRETTYITSPLRQDGYVDYLAALNDYCSQGITPENNAAVYYWQAVGPKEIHENVRQAYFQLLGIDMPPEDGCYFVSAREILPSIDLCASSESKTSKEVQEARDIYDRYFMTFQRPWGKDEFSEYADLLERNTQALETFIQGTRLTSLYSPLVAERGSSLNSRDFTLLMRSNDITDQLCMRMMFRLHFGDAEGAWQDILACHRWARLIGQGPFLLDWLTASSIKGEPWKVAALAYYGKITKDQSQRFQEDLFKLQPVQPIHNCWIKGERFYNLSSLLDIAINGYKVPVLSPELAKNDFNVEWHEEYAPLHEAIEQMADDTRIDWNEALRYMNQWHDRIVKSYTKPTTLNCKEAIAELAAEFSEQYYLAWDDIHDSNAFLQTVSEKHFTQQFVLLLMNAIGVNGWSDSLLSIKNNRQVYSDLSFIALALAGYHYEHHCYPKMLRQLYPKYLDTIFMDVYGDEEYHYKLKDEGYLLYSIGPNGQDDGGKNFNQDTDFTKYDEWEFSEEEKSADDIAIRVPPKEL
jgi:hypothetical protein